MSPYGGTRSVQETRAIDTPSLASSTGYVRQLQGCHTNKSHRTWVCGPWVHKSHRPQISSRGSLWVPCSPDPGLHQKSAKQPDGQGHRAGATERYFPECTCVNAEPTCSARPAWSLCLLLCDAEFKLFSPIPLT